MTVVIPCHYCGAPSTHFCTRCGHRLCDRRTCYLRALASVARRMIGIAALCAVAIVCSYGAATAQSYGGLSFNAANASAVVLGTTPLTVVPGPVTIPTRYATYVLSCSGYITVTQGSAGVLSAQFLPLSQSASVACGAAQVCTATAHTQFVVAGGAVVSLSLQSVDSAASTVGVGLGIMQCTTTPY